MLQGDEFGDATAIGVDEFAQAEHALGTPGKRRGAPFGKGFFGAGDDFIDFFDAGEIDMSLDFAGGGIVDRAEAAGLAADHAAANPMIDLLNTGRGRNGCHS